MKVYFTASVSAKQKLLREYTNIVNHLKSLGHEVEYNHILDASESKIKGSSKEQVLDFHSKMEAWIKACDFIVADTSFPSVSVGYEISLALRVGKPVLVFYGVGGPPSLLAYYKDEKLISEEYRERTYKETIDTFIRFIESKNDLRFTFFITPEIALFLDDIVQKEKTPKSVYIRKLIERNMRERESSS